MLNRLVVLAAILVTLVVTLVAHPDDPKVRDRRPPYRGPGYRSVSATHGGRGYSSANVNFPAHDVTLLSWLSFADFAGPPSSASDCWGYVSPAGREYAIIGLSNGTGFVDITNPSDPHIVAQIIGPNSLWRDVQVYQQYAYAVSEGGSGIQVIDLRQIDAGVVTHVGNVTTPGTTATHTVIVNEASGFLYRCGGDNNGLRIYSLADPLNPTYVGSYSDIYVHEAHAVAYTSGPWAGREIVFCCGGFNGGWSQTRLVILDVTNKSNIQTLSEFYYSNPAYSHQAWLTEDRKYLYLDDELDENGSNFTLTHVIDVSNLTSPFEASTFTNDSTAIGHNVYTRDGLLFEANYRSGLRVFDYASNPQHPTEIAYFDTWPSDDQAHFNGLWGNYPFFPSKIVIGSDLESGLFVWWVGAPSLKFTYPSGRPDRLEPDGDRLAVQVEGDLEPGTFQFFIDAGSGYQSAGVSDLGNGLFEVSIPNLPCGGHAKFYTTGQTPNGVTWNDPPMAPVDAYLAMVAKAVRVVFVDDLEADKGWTVGYPGDSATGGIWTRVDPNGTQAQPEDDHSATGSLCWVTGQGGVGGGLGEADVDGGATTLVSPPIDVSGMRDPRISYWRWYSNDKGSGAPDDSFVIQIANDLSRWVTVETLGAGHPEASGGWFFHEIRVKDFVVPNAQVRMRLIGADTGTASIVEAGLDDVEVVDTTCLDGEAGQIRRLR